MNGCRHHRRNGLIARFGRDQRGVSAIIFAIILPVILGMVGLSVEVGHWFSKKRSLQAAADAGAMAGALVLYQGGTWASAQTAASDFAVRNGANAANVSSANPPNSGAYTADANAVEVIVTETQTKMFSALFLSGTAATVRSRAVATAGSQDLGCVVALNGSASEAVHLSNQGRMNLTSCGLTVNSSSSTGTHMENNTQVNADFARLTGNYILDNSGTFGSTPVSTGQTATSDPYADLANPATPGSCSSGSVSGTITAGNYCGLNIANNTNVTLSAGTYYIKDGTFSMGANSRLYANAGVTIILTGSAYMNLSSNAYIQITAPTSGTYEGIAIMQDPDGTAATHTMDANVYIGLQGSIYFPNALLHMDSNSFITTSSVMTSAYATTQPANNSANAGCGLVVANTVHMDGNSRINLNNSSATCNTAQVPTTTSSSPTLVE